MRTTVASDVADGVVVTPVTGRVAPGAERVALTVETGLGAESSVLAKELAAVVGVDHELVVGMADEAAGGVDRFEGVAGAVTETGADGPGSLFSEGCIVR